MLKEIFYKERHKFGVLIFVHFGSGWVLPLKASLLFGIGVCVVFDGLEYSGSELRSETTERSLLL